MLIEMRTRAVTIRGAAAAGCVALLVMACGEVGCAAGKGRAAGGGGTMMVSLPGKNVGMGSYWGAWPAGADPAVAGRKVAENLLARDLPWGAADGDALCGGGDGIWEFAAGGGVGG